MIKQVVLLMGFMVVQLTFAQSYDLAAGVRLGMEVGVSIKMRVPPVDKNFTSEFIIQHDPDGQEVFITLLAAQHIPLITRRLNFYSGLGLHKGWIETDLRHEATYKAPFGVSLIGGAEVNFRRLSVSIDYKPVVNLIGGQNVLNSSSAVTIRYIPFQWYDIFISPREKRKRQRQKKRRQKMKDRASY